MTARGLARLSEALSIVLPTPVETSLLRVCLWTGGPARQAWATYRARAGDLRVLLAKDRRGLKKLMPLLLRAVQRNGLDVDDSLLTVLRTAHLRAALRSKTVHRIAHEVFHTLSTDRIPHIVLDGVAIADAAYPDPATRHCATIELLLPPGDLPRAARRLSALAAAPPGSEGSAVAESLTLHHGSGLPIELRSRLVRQRDHPISLDDLFAATRVETVAGIPARVLSRPDALLDACLKAFFGSHSGLVWVPDAWHLLRRSADLDWDLLLVRSGEGYLDPFLLITLGYLAEQLDCPIPATVLDRLRQATARTDPVRGERALAVAVRGAPGFVSRMFRMKGGLGPRLAIAKWMVCPSPGYLRANYRLSHAWQLPLYYLYRPLRFVTRQLGALGR